MNKAKVLVREKQKYVTVQINTELSSLVDDVVILKWQKLINLVAEILEVKAGLIMRITDQQMEVFLRSNNEDNPYPANGKDQLGHGLYCETVIGEGKKLFVEDARISEVWKDNPDVKINMISYLGLPIKNPDGSYFGTICALDDEAIGSSKKYIELLEQFRESIETDLQMIQKTQRIIELSSFDDLTGLYNRRSMNEFLQNAQDDINRELMHVSVAMIDLDNLKMVNDNLGHLEGDKVLQFFGQILKNRARKTDRAARYGGDEFIMLCRGTDEMGLRVLLQDIQMHFEKDSYFKEIGVSFSFGIASTSDQDNDVFETLKKADRNMYKQKNAKIRKAEY